MIAAANAAEAPPVPVKTVTVCIAGMHRSGTSLVTRLLHACGMFLGEDRDLMPPRSENPDGFWENENFTRLNERILSAMGGAWDCPPAIGTPFPTADSNLKLRASALIAGFDAHGFRGWKDPRNSLTLPFWSELLPDARVIIVVRNPLEAANSITQRNGFSRELGLALWQSYNERLLDFVPPENRLVTRYDAYFAAPENELRRVLDFLQITANGGQITQACAAVSAQLRHNCSSAEELTKQVPPRLLNLYTDLCVEAHDGKPAASLQSVTQARREAELRARLHDAHERLLERDALLLRQSREHSHVMLTHRELARKVTELTEILDGIDAAATRLYASRRWRWANPVAALRRWFHPSWPVRGYRGIDDWLNAYKTWRKRR